ncbi:MAG: hypothetical protein OXF08_11830 [Bacteroidetes bacterium]|nr:hypothetical protein [Bacteroidota bacterium]
MKSKTFQRKYLNLSTQQLAEILLRSPFITVSGHNAARPKFERLPLNVNEERKAYTHSQMFKELTHRLGSSTVTDKVILCAAYDHLHYQYGTYILRLYGADQALVDVTDPIEGVPIALTNQFAKDLIVKQPSEHDWTGWTLSVFLEDGKTEIYIALLSDLALTIKQISR